MSRIPPEIAESYRVATLQEIRAFSFGEVRVARDLALRNWRERRFSLADDAIFGPRRDYQCACGKFQGAQYAGTVCDECGVKLGPCAERRTRCGHIELRRAIRHPAVGSRRELEAIQVLPAVFWGSRAGAPLASGYDEVVRANAIADPTRIGDAVAGVFEMLVPVLRFAHAWDLIEVPILARGLGLVARADDAWNDY